MKKITLAIAPLALLLAACGGKTAATETVTVQAPPAPTASAYVPPASDPIEDYYAYVILQAPTLSSVSKSTLVETGQSLCSAFALGSTVAEVLSIGVESELDSTVLAALIVGAVKYLCPQYYDIVKSQV
jgi:hypothetical protein